MICRRASVMRYVSIFSREGEVAFRMVAFTRSERRLLGRIPTDRCEWYARTMYKEQRGLRFPESETRIRLIP